MKFLHILSILAIANATRLGQESDPEPEPEEVTPIDAVEKKIINGLMRTCKEEVFGMVDCYGKDIDVVMKCANCVYSGLLSEDPDANCDEIEQDTIVDYETCGDECDSTCDEPTAQLFSCGAPVFCSGALALKTE